MPAKIPPTIGRLVWFHPSRNGIREGFHNCGDQPMAATVAYVHPGERLVNLSVIDHKGRQHAFSLIELVQDGEHPPMFNAWCEWPQRVEAKAQATA